MNIPELMAAFFFHPVHPNQSSFPGLFKKKHDNKPSSQPVFSCERELTSDLGEAALSRVDDGGHGLHFSYI